MRHAVLASTFGILLALPLVSLVATPVPIAVPIAKEDSNISPLLDYISAPSYGEPAVDHSSAAPAKPGWSLFPLSTILLFGWFIGAALFMIPIVSGLLQVRSLRRFGLPWRHGQAVADGLATVGRRRVEVLLHESVPGPMTCGVLRPLIVLPTDAQSWDEQDLERAVVHELEHVRRCDWPIHCLARVACAAYWFHPLVWISWRQLALEAERSCDDVVLRSSEVTAYADQLVGLARRRSVVRKSPALAMASRSDLAARVGALLDGSQRRGPVGALLVCAACIAAAAVVLTVSPVRMVAQSPASPQSALSPPAFDSADVYVSASGADHVMTGGVIKDGGYELHHATMVGLIRTAWGVTADKVIGGPNWLDTDRFDVIAKTASDTSPDTIRMMLRSLLADRFKLTVREDKKLLPGFVLTAGTHPRLKAADGSGNSGCQPRQQSARRTPGEAQNTTMICRNITMADFAAEIGGMAIGYINHSVVDQTNLTGTWNFNITWTARQLLGLAGADGITFFDAVNKQLGLKLEPKNVPTSVIVVESLNQRPAGAVTQRTSSAPIEFEVAVIKPSEPDTRERLEFQQGGRIHLQAGSLKEMIQLAWNIRSDNRIEGAPEWLGTERFDLVAKAPAASQAAKGEGPPMDIEALRLMMRALLTDRFKLAAHTEERPASVYALVAAKPKLNKADPANRSGCTHSTGNAGKGAGFVSTYSYICQNTTMAQLAKLLDEGSMGDLTQPVFDSTGLDGAWDFELTWTPLVWSRSAPIGEGVAGAGSGVGTAVDPLGGLTLAEAIERQLGLKLEPQKRPVQILVIDHVEQKPTDN